MFIESMFLFQELGGNMSFNDVMSAPFPLFYDLLTHRVKMKEKEAKVKNKKVTEVTKAAKTAKK